ncbi:hypothetical protein [Hyphomonas sp.]|uniref:hypothetical protein n=1 Tax=Hyphomonas sp. TaxID=87 RepID=UPI0035274BDE
MLNWLIDTLNKLAPAAGNFVLISQPKFRALKPTWPVLLSLAFLGLAFLLADQGRAIIKYTASADPVSSLITLILLIVYCGTMTYTAFMLSAVTRRNYLDAADNGDAGDPIDSSIPLRLRFAYSCGAFLPLLFLAMCLWFQFGARDPRLWGSVFAGLLAGWIYVRLASWLNPRVSRSYSATNLATGFNRFQQIKYRFQRLVLLITLPGHKIAQAGIAALITTLVCVTLVSSPGTLSAVFGRAGHLDIGYLQGAWIFFAAFIANHLFFRAFLQSFVRLHQGHTSRYIVIDSRIERLFGILRTCLIVAIIASLWCPWFVNRLGPLGVGLLGTLWITLFLSALVETAARQGASVAAKPRDGGRALTIKTVLFLLLTIVLLADATVAILEFISNGRIGIGLITPIVIVLVVAAVIWNRKSIWTKPGELSRAVNRLPTATYLAPVLLLSLGEAHHIHRIDAVDATNPAHVMDLNTHAEAWLKARKIPASGGQGKTFEPVTAIIIMAEGGGIRAAAHTGYFMSQLDTAISKYCRTNPNTEGTGCAAEERGGRLLDYVYSINGVSGGSIGSAIYLAAAMEEQTHNLPIDAGSEFREELVDKTLRGDYLSPLLAGLFGSDTLTSIAPVQLPDRVFGTFNKSTPDGAPVLIERGMFDRADFFEERLANLFAENLKNASLSTERDASACQLNGDEEVQRTFDLPLETVAFCASRRGKSKNLNGSNADNANNTDPGPVVFFSTFYETGGFQMATSNVDIPQENSQADPSFCGSVPVVQQMLGFLEPDRYAEAGPASSKTRACQPRTQTLPLSTAAHLSARFPGSNPTGVIETRYADGRWKRHFFVDGGYLDNSGALSAIESLRALQTAANNLKIPINVVVLHLYALPIPEDMSALAGSEKRATKQDEFLRVPSAVVKARGAASRAPIRMLCNALKGETVATTDNCNEIFSRRMINPKQLSDFENNFPTELENNRPVLEELLKPITLKKRVERDSNPGNGQQAEAVSNLSPSPNNYLESSSWIPVPLEVAMTDRQDNAITALLGWTLLEKTSDDINKVMTGAAAEIVPCLFNIQSEIAAEPPNPCDHRKGKQLAPLE